MDSQIRDAAALVWIGTTLSRAVNWRTESCAEAIVALDEALSDAELSRYDEIEIFTDSKYVEGNQTNLKFDKPAVSRRRGHSRRSDWRCVYTGAPSLRP
jgi:ribonuclease HI